MKVKFEENSFLENDLIFMQSKEKTEEIESIIKDIESTKTVLQCSFNEKNLMIPCNDFIRFFSANKKIYGTTFKCEYITQYRLYELESFLQSNFIRISNTEIINIKYVKSLELTSTGNIIIYWNGNTFFDKYYKVSKHWYCYPITLDHEPLKL